MSPVPTHFSDERGAVFVEHTIALPLFFAILIVGFDLLRISYNAVTVQFVASRVMREASLGLTSASKIQSTAINLANKLGVPIKNSDVALCPAAQSRCTGINPGASLELMVLQIDVPINGLLFGSRLGTTRKSVFLLQAAAIGKMEPA